MIYANDDLNRRVRIIARTLAALPGNPDFESISAKSYFHYEHLNEQVITSTTLSNAPLLGNATITLADGMRSLIKDIASYCDYAGNSEFPDSSVSLVIWGNGRYRLIEEYCEMIAGEDGMHFDEYVDLNKFD